MLRDELASFTWRFALFFLLEAAYLILVTVCLFHTVVLPASWEPHQTQVRGAFTVITIWWQTIALWPLSEILSNAYSSEWHQLHSKSGRLEPGETDVVSTLSSGVPDRARYALTSSSASNAFRTCFIVSGVVLLLHHVAPGAMTISIVRVPTEGLIEIGNFTSPLGEGTNEQMNSAMTIARLENIEDGHFEYSMYPPYTIVGWPADIGYLNNQTTIHYQSDAAYWSHSCSWDASTPTQWESEGVAQSVWVTTSVQPGTKIVVQNWSQLNSPDPGSVEQQQSLVTSGAAKVLPCYDNN
jgi:hypothetical protein